MDTCRLFDIAWLLLAGRGVLGRAPDVLVAFADEVSLSGQGGFLSWRNSDGDHWEQFHPRDWDALQARNYKDRERILRTSGCQFGTAEPEQRVSGTCEDLPAVRLQGDRQKINQQIGYSQNKWHSFCCRTN